MLRALSFASPPTQSGRVTGSLPHPAPDPHEESERNLRRPKRTLSMASPSQDSYPWRLWRWVLNPFTSSRAWVFAWKWINHHVNVTLHTAHRHYCVPFSAFWLGGGGLELNRCSLTCSAAEITICVTERLLCVLLVEHRVCFQSLYTRWGMLSSGFNGCCAFVHCGLKKQFDACYSNLFRVIYYTPAIHFPWNANRPPAAFQQCNFKLWLTWASIFMCKAQLLHLCTMG